ncbi:Geraniol 8-hydroxylase [Nymphaea thermarum]|nr:Geraniol 8-hydroxylase [Nymphaea thermarum]
MDCFKPERFLDSTVDYKGRHFEYLPLALGTLLPSFDWVLPEGVTPETIDMSEKLGISLTKSVPLSAIPMPYPEEWVKAFNEQIKWNSRATTIV